MIGLAGHGKDTRLIQPVLFSVGDRVVDTDGEEGVITYQSASCLNIKKNGCLSSHNLETNTPKLRAVSNNNRLFEILLPICNYYCGKELATFAVNAIGHALDHARSGKIAEAIVLLTPEVLKELKKPQKTVVELKEFLKNPPNIEEVKFSDLETAITSEPKLATTNLRIDESRVSVLVEKENKSISTRTKGSKTCVDGISGKESISNFFHKRLIKLREQAIVLRASGASPKGVWLEKSRPSKRNFEQVVWKADKPHKWLDDKKSRYIGKVDSDEHKSALTQFAAGKKLREIEKEIQLIEKNLQNLED